ncbi:MAG: NADH-quinone oxidoreductase subunit H [Pseudomonadota bacterium]
MRLNALSSLGLCVLNIAIALFLAPLFEGIMRKLKAAIHSRQGPPIVQPYLDILKLLGKEDLRTSKGLLYSVAPAITLGSALLLALLVPMGTSPPLGFAGDVIVLLYVASMGAVFLMLTAFASKSPYAYVGGSREMMMLLAVEPVLVISLVVAAFKAGTLSVGGIVGWHVQNGPTFSMVIAAIVFFLALQAQVAKLPFDIAEADQEIMGGPLMEQSGPRFALFRWAMWVKQLVFAFLFVEVFVPWPRIGVFALDLLFTTLKVLIVLVLVALIDVVNPRLRVDQALSYFVRVGIIGLAALGFAVIGL